MVVQRKELLESLKMAMPGIETGSAVLQGADSFAFHDGKIFTYNDNISVNVPIISKGLLDEGVEGCVKADEFFKVISKFSSDEIEFTVSDDGHWNLKCGKAKVQMTLLNFDYESRLKNIVPDETKWQELDDDFLDALHICKMSSNKTLLSGIYVEGSDAVSTDGYQMNIFSMKKSLPRFWISDNSVNEILKLKKLVAMQLQGAWVHFKSDDGILFSVKTLQAEKFPFEKVKKIMDTTNSQKALLHAKFPKEMFEAIDRASSFSVDIDEHLGVKLIISKKKIEVSSERSSGKYNEKIDWEEELAVDFEPFVVYVDIQMMGFVAQRTTEFYLLQNNSAKDTPRLLFVTENSKHLLSTLSVNEED